MKRIKEISKLTLMEMILNFENYSALPDDLAQLPLPENIKIGRKRYPIPGNRDQFLGSLNYGQRLFMVKSEPNDFDRIFRLLDGYYFPIVTQRTWNDQDSLNFGVKILDCLVIEA